VNISVNEGNSRAWCAAATYAMNRAIWWIARRILIVAKYNKYLGGCESRESVRWKRINAVIGTPTNPSV
jgi:hypothetical protein